MSHPTPRPDNSPAQPPEKEMPGKRRMATAMPDWIGQLKEAGPGRGWHVKMKTLAEIFDPGMEREEPDWEDQDVQEVCAYLALRSEQTDPETKVFEAAGLNPKNPF